MLEAPHLPLCITIPMDAPMVAVGPWPGLEPRAMVGCDWRRHGAAARGPMSWGCLILGVLTCLPVTLGGVMGL